MPNYTKLHQILDGIMKSEQPPTPTRLHVVLSKKNHLTDNSFNCHDADEPKHDATGVKAYLDRKKTPKPTVGHY